MKCSTIVTYLLTLINCGHLLMTLSSHRCVNNKQTMVFTEEDTVKSLATKRPI